MRTITGRGGGGGIPREFGYRAFRTDSRSWGTNNNVDACLKDYLQSRYSTRVGVFSNVFRAQFTTLDSKPARNLRDVYAINCEQLLDIKFVS